MILKGFFVRCPECKKMHTADVNLKCTCGAYVPTWERHTDVPVNVKAIIRKVVTAHYEDKMRAMEEEQ